MGAHTTPASLLALSLSLGLCVAACRGQAGDTGPDGAGSGSKAPSAGAAAERATTAPITASADDAPADPRGAAERADLDHLCAALDHDYIDGTLSDYYGEVEPVTDWGNEVRDAGNEADLPGRHLQKEAKAFTDATGEPMPASCTELFAQLEDLE